MFQVLYRMSPTGIGSCAGIVDSSGIVRTDSGGKAEALNQHWQATFEDKSTPGADCSMFADAIRGIHSCTENEVMPTMEDIETSVTTSPNSATGVDGIPFRAYRKIVGFMKQLIMLLILALANKTFEVSGDFNESIMIFLPKEASGHLAGQPYFDPGSTRPLSLANTLTKLVCTACRISVERCVASRIVYIQRGFISGRQIIHNIIDMDLHARWAALRGIDPAMIFF